MHRQTQAWQAALTSENHVPHLHLYLFPSLPLGLLEAVQVSFSEPYIDLTVHNTLSDNSCHVRGKECHKQGIGIERELTTSSNTCTTRQLPSFNCINIIHSMQVVTVRPEFCYCVKRLFYETTRFNSIFWSAEVIHIGLLGQFFGAPKAPLYCFQK